MSEQKRPGRPPLSPQEPSTTLAVRVPTSTYDAAYAKAREERVSVPTVLRNALARYLDEPSR